MSQLGLVRPSSFHWSHNDQQDAHTQSTCVVVLKLFYNSLSNTSCLELNIYYYFHFYEDRFAV